jgi:hypothetical protein
MVESVTSVVKGFRSRASSFPSLLLVLVPILIVFDASLELATDADVRRYFAYSNAVLGRPYDSFYVRTGAAWKQAFISGDRSTLDEYARTGAVIRVGPSRPLLPYRDFFVEYPPGFLLAVLPPALLARNVAAYTALFHLWMAVLLTLAVMVCGQIAKHLGGVPAIGDIALWTGVAALAVGKVSLQRYDALVALLLCIMCWATLARRPTVLGIAAGLAVGVKLVPVFAAVVCGIYLHRLRRGRELVAAVVAAALVGAALCAPFIRGGSGGLADVVRYGLDRPLEFESLGAALLGLGNIVEPGSAWVTYGFGSTNVVGRYAAAALVLSSGAGLIAVLAIYGATWRALGPDRQTAPPRVLIAAIGAVLAAVIGFAKVGSIQYLVWLIPLGLVGALHRHDRWTLTVFVMALLLAQIGYPLASVAAESLAPWASACLLGRQVLLLVWAGREFRRETGAPAP